MLDRWENMTVLSDQWQSIFYELAIFDSFFHCSRWAFG